MRRILLSTMLPLAVALVPAGEANAQFGVGVGVYSGSPFYAPAIGFYPYYYRGFYGNGMSLYGPPVPTYSPVPGTFGASDYRVNQNAPFLPINLGFYAYRSPSRDVVPLQPMLPRVVGEPVASAAKVPVSDRSRAEVLVMEVHLPVASAEVFIDGIATKQTGEVRKFASPPLPSGENFSYEIRAEWQEKGEKVTRTRTTGGRSGEKLIVNFVEK